MRKNAKRVNRTRRTIGKRILNWFFNGVSRIAIAAGDAFTRNPVVTGGTTAFLVVLSFVTANAIWYQPQAHNNVFFKTRPDLEFQRIERSGGDFARLTGGGESVAKAKKAEPTDINQIIAQSDAVMPNPARIVDADNSSRDGLLIDLAPNGDKDVAILQDNLKQLGFYSGNVDGLTGPQTRKALQQWQDVQAKLSLKTTSGSDGQIAAPAAAAVVKLDDAVAVPKARPLRNQIDNSTTAATLRKTEVEKAVSPLPVTTSVTPQNAITAEQLVRIQAGLKAFGNDLVAVDGVPGKATEEAIREFQKLFRLNISGQADAELIGKMREIGLIS